MKTIKKTVKITAFFVLLVFVCTNLYDALSWKNNTRGIDTLYNSLPNSIDVLFVGSSHSFCTVNTAILWNKYGIAATDIGENGQPFSVDYTYLKESLKTQQPKVVFVELIGLKNLLRVSNGLIYYNTINMKWSSNYIENLNNALDRINNEDAENAGVNLSELKRDILLKYPILHTRYRELTKSDFENNTNYLRYSFNWSHEEYPLPEACEETDIIELTEDELTFFERIVELSKENNFELVFWVAPYYLQKEDAMRFNAVEEYCAKNGIAFYNFLKLLNETGFDFKTDMRKEQYAGSHINSYGAEKISTYICSILNKKYNLPDRRGDSKYAYYNLMSREWDVICAKRNMDNAATLTAYASALDRSLFEVTIIDYDKDASEKIDIIDMFAVSSTNVAGLYTFAKQNNVNKAWELSNHVQLAINGDSIGQSIVYNDSDRVQIKECDICVLVLDKNNGELIHTGTFLFTDGEYKKV